MILKPLLAFMYFVFRFYVPVLFGMTVYGNAFIEMDEESMYIVVIVAQIIMFIMKLMIKYFSYSMCADIISVINLLMPIQFLEDWIIQLSIINVTPFGYGYFILITVIFILEIFRDVDGYEIFYYYLISKYKKYYHGINYKRPEKSIIEGLLINNQNMLTEGLISILIIAVVLSNKICIEYING